MFFFVFFVTTKNISIFATSKKGEVAQLVRAHDS